MEHYVTLFDRFFLPQGLALHQSLVRHCAPFKLWILCMDEHTKRVLDALNYSDTISTVGVWEIETPALIDVKRSRSRVEYCWTLTPFTPSMVFDRAPEVTRVTYLDADLYFLRSPRPIFEEFERSCKAVLITDHAYEAEYDQAATSGQFCVQFIVFKRDASRRVAEWWQERCLDWCFNRIEDGKLGDQKYLDEWPTLFSELVHVLERQDLLLAPWNARRFPYSRAVAWHFHGLRLLGRGKVLLHGPYKIPTVVHRHVYEPYLAALRRSLEALGEDVVQVEARWRTVHRLRVIAGAVRQGLNRLSESRLIRRMPR